MSHWSDNEISKREIDDIKRARPKCHCGKRGHALNSVNCPVHGAPNGMTIVWLREIGAGTDNACWVVCAKGDLGAWAFAPLDFK